MPKEIEAMESLGIDIMGMSETHCMDTTIKSRILSNIEDRVLCSTTYITSKYQPGGNLLTITSRTTGCITNHGTDAWGWYCWHQLWATRLQGWRLPIDHSLQSLPQGKWQEPRAAHSISTAVHTHATSRSSWPRSPTSIRKWSLHSHPYTQSGRLSTILMMDTNGDHHSKTTPDTALSNFIIQSHLTDPVYNKFQSSPQTLLYGSKWINYIFVVPALSTSIHHRGYLGTHMGADSDHCLAYIRYWWNTDVPRYC